MKDSEIADEKGKGDVNAIKIRRLAQKLGTTTASSEGASFTGYN